MVDAPSLLPVSQAIDHVVKYMTEMKGMLYGEAGEKPAKEAESKQLAVEAARSKLLRHMCTLLSPLGFEVRAQTRAGLGPPSDAASPFCLTYAVADSLASLPCLPWSVTPAGWLRPAKTWPPCSPACCGRVWTGASLAWPTWRSTGTCWSP